MTYKSHLHDLSCSQRLVKVCIYKQLSVKAEIRKDSVPKYNMEEIMESGFHKLKFLISNGDHSLFPVDLVHNYLCTQKVRKH